MKKGDHAIGLFQGMFEKNIMTFTIRVGTKTEKPLIHSLIYATFNGMLKTQGIKIENEADESSTGPASFTGSIDPDGNPILIDQHSNRLMPGVFCEVS